MSTEALMQFYDRAMTDPALQAEAAEALAAGPSSIVALGQRLGYDFTADELTDQLTRLNQDQELSDEDLDAVSAGESMSGTATIKRDRNMA